MRTERCVGKPRLRVAREISRKQALRLESVLALCCFNFTCVAESRVEKSAMVD